MKIKWLEKIIIQIQKDMHCPRCKHIIDKDFIEITEICGSDFVKFGSYCQKCGTTAKITAKVEETVSRKDSTKLKLKQIKEMALKKKNSLNLLRNSLSTLNSTNLRTILSPSSRTNK